MSEAPERIWAVFDEDISAQTCDVYAQLEPEGFVDKPTEYRRADLPPTPAQIMADPRIKALVEALEGCIGVIEHIDMADGVCCCGDNMDGHSNPMDCGHVPTDAGEYHAALVASKSRAALSALEPKP